VNGFGAALARRIAEIHPERGVRVDVLGVPDRIIEHASRREQLEECGLDEASIAGRIRTLAHSAGGGAVRETA
jgi:deoxyxylulose-5-phosphate synthase